MSSRSVAVLRHGNAPVRASKIPRILRFPLVVLLSLTLSSLLYTAAAEYTTGDLAGISKRLDQWWEIGTLVGWRTFELGLGWFADYDGYDLASLTLLCHGPPIYLLGAFYKIQPWTVLSSLLIDVLTTYIPFRLLRPLSRAHSASAFSTSVSVPNREIVTDLSISTITALLASVIYSTTVYTASATFLPFYLVTYFDGITSLEAVYTASPISLLPITFLFGLASKSFIFTPAAATPTIQPKFNPVTASLWETLAYNVWGYSTRTKVVIKRTVALVIISGINTLVQSFITVEGVEIIGAIAYSVVWSTAAGVTGLVLGFVGSVEG